MVLLVRKNKQRSCVLFVVQVYKGHVFGVRSAENAEKGETMVEAKLQQHTKRAERVVTPAPCH